MSTRHRPDYHRAIRAAAAVMTVAASGALVTRAPAEAVHTRAPVATPDTFGVHQGTTVRVPCPGVLRNDASTGRLRRRVGGRVDEFLKFTLAKRSPVTKVDKYSVAQNRSLTVPASEGVLTNDTDADGDTLRADQAGSASHGTMRLNATSDFQCTPDPGFTGTDRSSYHANDSVGRSARQVVTVTVIAPNRPPVVVNDTFRTGANGQFTVPEPGVLSNDTDPIAIR